MHCITFISKFSHVDGDLYVALSLYHKSKTMDQEKDSNELRLKLGRRNQLLEIIRKAYHRDVIVLREYLLQLQNRNGNGANVNVSSIQDIKPEDLDLRTIPSIDLRQEGFHLFSPQECELIITPCLTCGGTLEIVHRESHRFEQLMRCCNDLKLREKDLDQNLAIANTQIEVGKNAMLKQEVEMTEEQNELNANIDRLKEEVADRDALERLCDNQKEQIKALEVVQEKKVMLENCLSKSEKELMIRTKDQLQARKTISQNNSDIYQTKKRCEEGLLREEGLNNRVEQLSVSNADLRRTITTLEELEIQVKDELNMCRSSIHRCVPGWSISIDVYVYINNKSC